MSAARQVVPVPSAPWISEDLLRDTVETLSAIYGCTLTRDEAAEILLNVGLLFDRLGDRHDA